MKRENLVRHFRRLSEFMSSRWVSYFDGVDFHDLRASSTQKFKQQSPSSKVVVLSRRCYSEQTKSYPVKSRKELGKVLGHEFKGAAILYLTSAFKQGRREVLIFRLPPEVISQIRPGSIVIPETLVVANFAHAGFWLLNTPQGSAYFHISDGSIKSARAGGVISDAASARIALGVNQDAKLSTLAWSEYRALLTTNLLNSRVFELKGKQLNNKVNKRPIPWKQVLASSTVIVLGYVLVSSLYLNITTSQRYQALDNFGGAVNERLAERQRLERNLGRIEELTSITTAPEKIDRVWSLYVLMRQQGVTVNSYNVTGELSLIDVTGEVVSATALLTQLNQQAGIENVQLTAPVRRGRSGEAFSLRIVLEGGHGE